VKTPVLLVATNVNGAARESYIDLLWIGAGCFRHELNAEVFANDNPELEEVVKSTPGAAVSDHRRAKILPGYFAE
jgi:hypothetical protein